MNLSKKNLPVLAIFVLCGVTLLLTACKKSSTTNYNVSVTTTGLIGSGVVVQLNGAYNLTIPSNGVSTFTTQFPNDSGYGIAITRQPTLPPQTCVLANANGTISGADVTNVTMTCTPVEFAFLTNTNANSIIQLAINESTGVLSQYSVPAVTGDGPVAFALDKTGRFAYAVNKTGNSISAYLANTSNALLAAAGTVPGSAVTTQVSISTPTAVVIDPTSQFVYVANVNTTTVPSTVAGTIAGFAITPADGTLTCVGYASSVCPATPTATTGKSPSAMAIVKASNGIQYLLVTNSGDNTISEYFMEMTSTGLTGALGSLGTVATGNAPVAIAATGSYVYVVNSTDATISSYTMNAGVLMVNGAAVSTGGANPSAIAISPNGLYVYVTNKNGNSIAAYSIGSTGGLKSLGTPLMTGNQPVSVGIDPQGAFAYVSNLTDNSVTTYAIGSGGSLSLATFSPNPVYMGNGPISFVTSSN